MDTENVITPEYELLQNDIVKMRVEWKKGLQGDSLFKTSQSIDSAYPLVPQLTYTKDLEQYLGFMQELMAYLKNSQAALKKSLEKIETLLNEELALSWFNESIALNDFYFSEFARKQNLQEWIPQFIAENAVRPYLQLTAELSEPALEKSTATGFCPCCGEPPRLAKVGKKGKKELLCPRCYYSWEEKKLSCAHCGSDHEDMLILKIEEKQTEEIHVCKKCEGYTKVIDVRKLFKVPAPELLDLHSLHLDYIAQEKGYGVIKNSETN